MLHMWILWTQQQLNVDCAYIYKMLTNLTESMELTVSKNVYPLSGIYNFTSLQHIILYKIFSYKK